MGACEAFGCWSGFFIGDLLTKSPALGGRGGASDLSPLLHISQPTAQTCQTRWYASSLPTPPTAAAAGGSTNPPHPPPPRVA